MRAFIRIPLLFLTIFSLNHSVFAEDPNCNVASVSIAAASRIRGLKIKSQVPCSIRTKDEVRGFITKTLATKIPRKKLEQEEKILKVLGVIPEEYDFVNGITDLYVNQVGGYYDPDKKQYVMAGWLPSVMQPTIAVHELTHALQDQYYNLSKFVDDKIENSDLVLAHSALIEGDATAVMTDYNRELAGAKHIQFDPDVDALLLQTVLSSAALTSDGAVPSGLVQGLIFPYTSGLRFVHTLLKKNGYPSIDGAFKNPPNSTHEILHPEIYAAGIKDYHVPSETEVRHSIIGPEYRAVFHDSEGEFFISTMLGSFIKDKKKVASVAAAWAGDAVYIFSDPKKPGSDYVIWKIDLNSSSMRDEFKSLYLEALKERFKKSSAKTDLDLSEWVESGPKEYRLEFQGNSVFFEERDKAKAQPLNR